MIPGLAGRRCAVSDRRLPHRTRPTSLRNRPSHQGLRAHLSGQPPLSRFDLDRREQPHVHPPPTDDAAAALFGNRFVTREVPTRDFPTDGMPAVDAMRLVGEDLALEDVPARNLATFVTTWMEPQAQRIIAENLHRNFIDHAEYPRTAEISSGASGCWPTSSMLLARRPAARTQGSSEAIMLGGPLVEVELAQAA